MKKVATAAVLGFALGSPALADTVLGIYAGAGNIDFDMSGSFRDLSTPIPGFIAVDLENDLGLSGDTGNYFYVALEHPIPILPNVKLARTEMEDRGSSVLRQTISIDGVVIDADFNVESEMDLTHTDLTFYYEVLDNWLNLDLGVSARKFDGGLEATGFDADNPGTRVTATQELKFTAPLLYGKVHIELPLTGLYVAADGNWIGYDGSSFYDAWARLGYVFSFGLGVEAGYRRMQLDIDDIDDLEADITVDGNYVAATFHF